MILSNYSLIQFPQNFFLFVFFIINFFFSIKRTLKRNGSLHHSVSIVTERQIIEQAMT